MRRPVDPAEAQGGQARDDGLTDELTRLMGEGTQNPHELRLRLPAAHSHGRMGRQVLRKFAENEGLPDEELSTLEFVADELMTNAIDHGGGNAAREEADLVGDVRMTIELVIRDDVWKLRVEDQGGGSPEDVAHIVGTDALPDLEDERGRGFFLMGPMVDDLNVEKSRDGRGLAFVATKRYGPAAG